MIQEIPAAVRTNPFPGLRPFEPDEDFLFFGREKQIDELLRRLRTTRFLAVLGTSGSGKSSLVRSGLIPSLYGGGMTRAGSSWRMAIVRPGDDPFGNLAQGLAAPEALGEEDEDGDLTRAFFETTLRASRLGLAECVVQARLPEGDNVLVLVDQFEELFRFRQARKSSGHEEAVAFVKLLVEASRHPELPLYVALTMRSDFIGHCMDFLELPEVINEGLYLVPRLNRDELRAAITGPVAVGEASISLRLVSRLLNDVGDNPDQLPILQHALMRTWDCWEEDHGRGEPLDLRHYEAIGTMSQALSQHAEEALGELDEEGRRIAAALFKALTEKGADGLGIRRPAALHEICELTGAPESVVAGVIDRFRLPGRSFLMPPVGTLLRSSSILDISHESLMRIWERLCAWVDDEAQSAQIYLGVARAAAHHEEGTAALWRDPELQMALTWRKTTKPTEAWAQRYDPKFERAMRFLDASEEEKRKEVLEREEHRRGELRRKWLGRVIWVVGAVMLVILGLSATAYHQRNIAVREAAKAKLAQSQARGDAARAKKAEASANADRQEARKQEKAAQNAKSRAEKQEQFANEQKKQAEEQRRFAERQSSRAQDAEDTATKNAQAAEKARIQAEEKSKEAEHEKTLAEDSRREAKGSELKALRLSRLALARAVALQVLRLPIDQKELPALLALAAYRLHLENGGDPEEADQFNALRTALDRLRRQPAWTDLDAVRAVAVDPQGALLFSGSEDGRLRQLDLRSSESQGKVLIQSAKGVRAVAVDSEGRLLAAGTADGSLSIFSLRNRAVHDLTGPGSPVVAVAFQPGRRLLAVGRSNGDLSLWDIDNPRPPRQLRGAQQITAVAFDAQGSTLAAGLGKGGALLWNLNEPSGSPRKACAGKDVQSVAFSPRSFLACGTTSGEIFFDSGVGPGSPPSPLLGHQSTVSSLSFNRSGLLVSGSTDHTVRLWNLSRTGAEPRVLPGHSFWVWSVAFLPSGDRVVSGGADRTVRLWAARSKNLVDELCRNVSRPLTEKEWEQLFPPDTHIPYDEGGEVCPHGAAKTPRSPSP